MTKPIITEWDEETQEWEVVEDTDLDEAVEKVLGGLNSEETDG